MAPSDCSEDRTENPQPRSAQQADALRKEAETQSASSPPAPTAHLRNTEADAPHEKAGRNALPPCKDDMPATASIPPSFADRCFNVLSYAAFLILPLLLAAQFRMAFPGLTPWLLPQEAGFAEQYELAKAAGQWLVPSAGVPPLWFWLLRAVNGLPYVDGPLVYTVAALFTSVLTLLASWFLALSVGWGRRVAFAGGLALLSCLYFPPVAHRVGPESLSAGLIVLASACLFRGWSKERSFLWLGIGGLLSGAAGVSGGLFGLMLPLLSSLVFLSTQGKLQRLNKPDGAFGFGLLLLLPLVWLGAAILLGNEHTPLKELGIRLIAPLLPPYWPPKEPAWFYVLLLPAAVFPWILALPFTLRHALKSPQQSAAQRPQPAGTAWIWLNLLLGLLLLSAASDKSCLSVLPLVPLAALILGRTLAELPPAGSRVFFLILSSLFMLTALALGLGALFQAWPALRELLRLPRPDLFAALHGLPLPALVCAASALVLWKIADRRFPSACLLISVLCVTALCQIMLLRVTPAMQDILAAKTGNSMQAAPQTSPGQTPAPEVPVRPQSTSETTSPVPAEKTDPGDAPRLASEKEEQSPAQPMPHNPAEDPNERTETPPKGHSE